MWALKAGKGCCWRGTVVKVTCSVGVDSVNRRVCWPALVKCQLHPVTSLLETELVPGLSCSPLRLKHNYVDGTLTETQQISDLPQQWSMADRKRLPALASGVQWAEASNWISTTPLTQEVCIYFSCFTFWIFNEVSVSDGLSSAVRSAFKPLRRAQMKRRPCALI